MHRNADAGVRNPKTLLNNLPTTINNPSGQRKRKQRTALSPQTSKQYVQSKGSVLQGKIKQANPL